MKNKLILLAGLLNVGTVYSLEDISNNSPQLPLCIFDKLGQTVVSDLLKILDFYKGNKLNNRHAAKQFKGSRSLTGQGRNAFSLVKIQKQFSLYQ